MAKKADGGKRNVSNPMGLLHPGKSMKRNLKKKNYGLAIDDLEQLGMMLDQELQPGIGTEWDYEAIR